MNLLDDHLVDVLLDVAASGENVLEREGHQCSPSGAVRADRQPATRRKGELRPQLLDRFGLFVEVGTPTAIAERVEVVRRRETFERDPAAFVDAWRAADTRLRQKVLAARRKVAPSM